MGAWFDPEVPAGYQDADIEQAEYEAQAREGAALRRRGVCTHGWMMGGGAKANSSRADIEQDRQRGSFPERETDVSITCQDDIPAGKVLCLDCGEVVADPLADLR